MIKTRIKKRFIEILYLLYDPYNPRIFFIVIQHSICILQFLWNISVIDQIVFDHKEIYYTGIFVRLPEKSTLMWVIEGLGAPGKKQAELVVLGPPNVLGSIQASTLGLSHCLHQAQWGSPSQVAISKYWVRALLKDKVIGTTWVLK